MRDALRKLAATVLFLAFVVLFAWALEGVARRDWLGPVVRGSLEGQFDAGALFYTEVEIDALTASGATDPGE